MARSPLVGEALARFLARHGGLDAVHATLEGVVNAAHEVQPDLLLLDGDADRTVVAALAGQVQRVSPGTQLLLLVRDPGLPGERLANEIGAAGCVSGQLRGLELVQAVVEAHCHGRVSARGEPSRRSGRRSAQELLLDQLTEREVEILSLLAAGRRPDEMATILAISPHTVRTHIQNMMLKLGVHSRLEAVSFARRSGLLAGPAGVAVISDVTPPEPE
jgi:two-component system nitrate/nitrite response regulator NarL